MRDEQWKEILTRNGIWLLIAAYGIVLSFITVAKYTHFLFHDFDLAIHAQTVWNILQGAAFSSVLGISFLGNHANFISFLLAPFYAICPTPATLLVLQTAAIAFTAYPLFLIARRTLSPRIALSVSALYLLYPGTVYTNLFEFHPTPFAAFFLAWMLYHFLEKDLVRTCAYAFLAMLCQENIALIVLMTGVLAWVERRPLRWGLVLFLAGAAWFLLCVKVLMPPLAAGKVNFFSLYGHLGDSLWGVVAGLAAHPGKAMALLAAPDRLEYLVMLFIPLSFIPLLGARGLLPILAIFLQHMLSNRMTERSLEFHYTAEMLPFIFFAFILGLGALSPRPRLLKGAVAMAFICTGVTFIQGPFQRIADTASALGDPYPARLKDRLVKEVPAGASLVATFDFLPRAAHRRELYSFHHIYSGYYTLSDKSYPLPPSVEYALLDMQDPLTFGSFYHPQAYLNLQRFLGTFRLGPVFVRDNFMLLARDAVPRDWLFSRSPAAPPEAVPLFSDGEVTLEKAEAALRGDVLHLLLSWRAEARPARDLGVYVDFIDGKGALVRRLPLAVCYRIFPTQAWGAGERVTERRELTVPGPLAGRVFSIRIGFFDEVTRRILGQEVLVPVNKGD